MAHIPQIVEKQLNLPPQPEVGGDKYLRLIRQLEDNIIEEIMTIRKEINGRLSFGSPDASQDGGLLQNIEGAHVSYDFDTADNPEVITHNLDTLFVRYLVLQISHDGQTAGTNAASTISIVRDTVTDSGSDTTSAYTLRLYAGGSRTVSVTYPVTVDFFFMRAVEA